MPYKHVIGDLLDLPEGIRVFAHGCNTMNVMGKGLALSVKQRYPALYEADTLMHKEKKDILGKCSYAPVPLKDGSTAWGFNLYQQSNYYAFCLLAFQKAMVSMMNKVQSLTCKNEEPLVVGLPWNIGCGLGNGDWREVKQAILSIMADYPNPLVFVEYPSCPEEKSKKPQQPR